MELRHVRYFLAVAEEGNFTRAAQRVGIGQPLLSQQIRDLEREVGARLFKRLPHGAELTEAGRAFLPEARAIIAQSERAIRAARRGAHGEVGQLRFGFTPSAAFNPLVPEVIRAFKGNYPEVELIAVEADTTTLLEHLRRKEIDAGFIRPGRLDPEGVRLYDVAHEPMVAVLPADHPLAQGDMLNLAALADETFVFFPRNAGVNFFDDVIATCQSVGFTPVQGQVVTQLLSIGSAVAAGLGVSVVPQSLSQVHFPHVKYVPIAPPFPVARLALATRDEIAPVVRNLIALLQLNS